MTTKTVQRHGVKFPFQNGRLHPNWGDRLTTADVHETIVHFEAAARTYRAMRDRSDCDNGARAFAERQLAFAEGRVRLWRNVLEAKARGESVMPLLNAAPRTSR